MTSTRTRAEHLSTPPGGSRLSSRSLVIYVSAKGCVEVRAYDPGGMLVESRSMSGISHIRVEPGGCTVNISLAEFEEGLMLRVSGAEIGYRQVSSVLEVRCAGP